MQLFRERSSNRREKRSSVRHTKRIIHIAPTGPKIFIFMLETWWVRTFINSHLLHIKSLMMMFKRLETYLVLYGD